MRRISHQLLLLLSLLSLSTVTFAWTQSIEGGYGYSHDPNHTKYNNSGVWVNSDLMSIYCNDWSHWSLNGAVGKWHTTTPVNQDLFTIAASLSGRIYPFRKNPAWLPYIIGSAGPAYISSRTFGLNTQGSNLSGQWTGGLGIEHNHFDVNLRMVHFSNAHLAKPDQGFNFQYTLSVGYLFF